MAFHLFDTRSPPFLNSLLDENFGRASFQAETRAVMKAVPYRAGKVIELTEAGRVGKFTQTAGNFASRVSADTNEGVYLAIDGTATTAAALVRRDALDKEWRTEWFGLPLAASDGTGSNCDTALAAMFALAEIDKPSVLRFGPGVFALDAAPPQIGYINAIRGSLGTQPTIIYKRYAEGSADRGVFARGNYGGVFSDFSLQGSGTASGGRGLSAVLTGAAPNVGELRFERLNISMGASGASADIFIDGSSNTSSAKGYRQIFVEGCKLFGGTGGTSRPAIEAKSVQHLFIDGLIQDKILLKGSSSVSTDDVQMKDVLAAVSGDALQLGTSTSDNVMSRISHSGTIVGGVASFGGGNTTIVSLNRVTGTVTRSWDVTTCGTGQASHTLRHFGFTLANGADSNFGTQTKLFGTVHVVTSAGDAAMFNLRGTANATLLLAGDATKWSNTAGTTSKINVFYNGSGYYGIQNNSGASLNFSFLLMGEPTSF